MADTGLCIGLDIDDKSVKFAKIKQTNGTVTLLKCAVRDVPQSEDKVKAISSILKDLFSGEKGDAEVYSCAYGNNIALKRISIPVMPDEEIPEAIKWEAKNLVPFPIENAVVDYYKIGKTSEKATEKYDVMFAVAGGDLISFFDSVAKESNIKFSGISIIPLALSSVLSMSKKCEDEKICAIIDIGGEAASINLFKGNVLQFTREITVAGDSLTRAMTGLLVADHWQLNLTYEQAEEIKKKFGLPKKDTTETTDSGIPLVHIYEMMAPTLRRLQNEILRSFDYYKEEFREEKIDSIYLTGGSSSLKNLEEYLSNALGTKVETIDPLATLKTDPSIDQTTLAELSPRLLLAIGIAMERSSRINFMKSKQKPKRSKLPIDDIFKGVKVPVNLLAAVGIALIVCAVSYNIYLRGIRDNLRKELMARQLLLSDVKALIEKRAILEQISKEETHVRDTLSQISQALPYGVELTDLSYDNSGKKIFLSGVADSTESVGKLLKNFEDSPSFRKTVLIEARKAVVDNLSKVLFKMTFNLI